MRSTLVERMLGLVTLDLDTGAAKAEGEGTCVKGLQAGMARRLHDELFRRKALAADGRAVPAPGGAAGVPGADGTAGMPGAVTAACRAGEEAGESPLATYELATRELVLAALSESRVAAQVASVLLLLVQGANLLGDAHLVNLNHLAREAAALPAALLVAGTLAVLALALVAGFVVSVAASLVSLAGFNVRRYRDRIVVERGLLGRSSHAVALERVQLVRVSQGLVRQLMGYAEVRALVVAAPGTEETGKSEGVVLHPFVRVGEVDRFLARMLPSYAAVPSEAALVRLPARAARRQAVRSCVACLLAGVACAAPAALASWLAPEGVRPALAGELAVAGGVVWVAAVAALALGAVLRLRDSRIGHDGRHLVVVCGGTRRRTLVAPRPHLQHATVSETPFQRRAGVATFRTRTAATEELALRDLARADADALLAWVRPRR